MHPARSADVRRLEIVIASVPRFGYITGLGHSRRVVTAAACDQLTTLLRCLHPGDSDEAMCGADGASEKFGPLFIEVLVFSSRFYLRL